MTATTGRTDHAAKGRRPARPNGPGGTSPRPQSATPDATAASAVDSEDNYSLHPRYLWKVFARQSFAFKIACFYLFIEYVRPQSLWPVIDVLPYAQTALIAGLVVALATESNTRRVSNAITPLLAFFTFCVLISIIFAYNPLYSLSQWDRFVPWLIAYTLILLTVNSRTRWYFFLLLFLLFSFKMSQHGFQTWAQRGFSAANWGVVGAPGYFRNAADFGAQMCIFLPMSLAFIRTIWDSQGRFVRFLLCLMPLTAAGTVLATNNRGTVVGAVCCLLWYFGRRGRRLKGLVVATVVLALGFLVLPEGTKERFRTAGTDETSISRLTYWEDGFEIIGDHPIVGIGYRNWQLYYPAAYGKVFEHRNEVAHSTTIEAGSELGLLGLLAFALLIASTFRANKQTRERAREVGDKFAENMSSGLDAAMIGLIVASQFISVLYWPFYWIAFALTASLKNAVFCGDAIGVETAPPRRHARRSVVKQRP